MLVAQEMNRALPQHSRCSAATWCPPPGSCRISETKVVAPAPPMTDQAKQQFGPVAAAYASSSFHAQGPDLARLVAAARFRGTEAVLDLGCGAGHTTMACANHAARVIGIDVTPEMVGVA